MSCNPDEPIPSYIKIEPFVLSVKSDGSQGSASAKITDAWVYIDETLVGIFETPATIPVLYWGSNKVRIRAGIKTNGSSGSRQPYPFFKDYETTVELTGAQVTIVQPLTSYQDFARFVWLENFETLDFTLQGSGYNQVSIGKNPAAFEGNHAAYAELTAGTNAFECESKLDYTLPKSGTPVWLEIHFKTDYPITMGLYAGTGLEQKQSGLVILATSSGWNKIYIDMTEGVSTAINLQNFRVFFGCTRSPEDAQATHHFYIDNIKLVTI